MESGFLADKEVHKVRPLWEAVFSEDSKAFTDYYFANKAEHNLVFTRTDGERIVAMLHLTPHLTGSMDAVCYIVGVATDAQYRRQGLMDGLLKEALQFMWEEGQPFTFLMPANPAYYTPYQFTYIYDKPIWKLNETILPVRYLEAAAKYEAEFHLVVKDVGTLKLRTAKTEDMSRVAIFANDYLKENADCYMSRNPHYYQILKKELIAQNGNLFLIEQENKLQGILAFTKEGDSPGIQEIILSRDMECYGLVCRQGYKPTIMARILRVEKFISNMRGRDKLDLNIRIKDDLIGPNSGVYRLCCKKAGGTISCKKMTDTSVTCEITIDDLTAFCFGYKSAEECFIFEKEAKKEEILKELEGIERLKRVFINEIV